MKRTRERIKEASKRKGGLYTYLVEAYYSKILCMSEWSSGKCRSPALKAWFILLDWDPKNIQTCLSSVETQQRVDGMQRKAIEGALYSVFYAEASKRLWTSLI